MGPGFGESASCTYLFHGRFEGLSEFTTNVAGFLPLLTFLSRCCLGTRFSSVFALIVMISFVGAAFTGLCFRDKMSFSSSSSMYLEARCSASPSVLGACRVMSSRNIESYHTAFRSATIAASFGTVMFVTTSLKRSMNKRSDSFGA